MLRTKIFPPMPGETHQKVLIWEKVHNLVFKKTIMELIRRNFGCLRDFRVLGRVDYDLLDIIFMSICAVICGEEDYVGIWDWSCDNEDWLRQHLVLENGIPSHDTFRRVFQFLDYESFSKCFVNFTRDFCELRLGEVVSIDGKCLRGSKDKSLGKKGIYMVGAWANAAGLLLGQVKVDDKSNEITAIPKLLGLLVLKGCTITIDSMGCQKAIASAIIEKEADYILALKGNQKLLKEQVERSFHCEEVEASFTTEEKSHGRLETRKCEVISDLKWIEEANEWKNLSAIVKITAQRTIISEQKTSTEVRYFIASQAFTAAQMLNFIRSHWGIENNLHWTLDVAFNEDNNRNRKDNSAQNFSFLNRIALNLLKKENTKISIKRKRNRANRSSEFLEKILRVE
jgi:predicted transposase YbfD/YdcC